jgi:hypothetical protein
MTHDRLLDDLRAANPVPDPDALELPATLAARALATPQPRVRRREPRRRLLPAAGVLALAGAAVAVLLLALGGGGAGTPDLAARAYAATAAHGVTHWQVDLFNYTSAGKLGMHQRTEGWRRGATMHVVHSELHHGREHATADTRTVGHRVTTWMSISDTYDRMTLPRRRSSSSEDVTFRDGDPMLAFRAAYQEHRLRDLGHGRFDVVFRHMPPGSVVYEVDPDSGRPLALVMTNPQSRSVWRFTTYESLPDTKANRDKLLLLPHPGAGPGDQDPKAWFRVLREGPRPPARWQRLIDRMGGFTQRRFGEDPSTARMLTKDVILIAGRHYICMDQVSTRISGSPKLARMLAGPSIGGTCVPIKKAIESGVSVGGPDGVTVAVPDGTTAIETRYRWHGPWKRIAAPRGYARLPGLGYEVRLAG